jgi:hypothetical protein
MKLLLVVLALAEANVAIRGGGAANEDYACLFTHPCKYQPKITIRGPSTVHIKMLTPDEVAANSPRHYDDMGASCSDIRDGDLSEAVVTTGDVINLKKPGEYQFHYECVNKHQVGAVATRHIIVEGLLHLGSHKPATLGTMSKYLDNRPKGFVPSKKQYQEHMFSTPATSAKPSGTCSFEPKHARR